MSAPIKPPTPIKMPCVDCADMFYPDGKARCNRCDFVHRFLKPMLSVYAPDAEIHRTPRGVVARILREGVRRNMPFDTDMLTPGDADARTAATYERVRRLADPDFKFDWKKESTAC